MGSGHDGWKDRDDLETELKYIGGAFLVFVGLIALVIGIAALISWLV